MVRPRESRENRLCLACGGSTRVSHLGLDLCRACAVFHRRSNTRNYVCRSKTDDCQTDNGRCRKCRFKRIDRMITCSHLIETIDSTEIHDDERHNSPLISKLLEYYRGMCNTRLIAELNARSSPPHPLEMNDSDFIPIPSTPIALDNANRIFLSAILNFGERVFPEFDEFNKAEKWSIATNFFHRFRLFEAGFRAEKKFPEDVHKSFGSYTTYVSVEVAESFYEDARSNRMMAESLRKDLGPNRERFRRLKLHDEEFVSVLALMFWNTDISKLSKFVQKVGAQYRATALQELNYFYRKDGNVDYASRLGEVLLFLDIYSQLSAELNHKFELLRLANVFTEETVLYKTTSEIE